MKLKVLVNASCFIILTSAIAGFTSQQSGDTPAEKEYKNIKVFKGVPAKEIDPAMDAITAALGVRCTFCHVRDEDGTWHFEKDDKPEKETARSMVLMMRKLNDENFNGRMEVTCATCHQGRSHPLGIAPIGQTPPPPRGPAAADAPKLPDGAALLEKYMQAIGGTAVEKITSLHIKSSQQAGQRTFTAESFAKSPSKVAHYFSMPRGNVAQGFDGAAAWFKNETGVVFDLKDGDADEIKNSTPFNNLWLKDHVKDLRRVRKDTLDGKEVYVAEARDGEDRVRYSFDATSGLLLRKWIGKSTILGIVPSTEDYSDYRAVNGVQMPFKVIETTHRDVTTITITDITANESIEDAKFTKPAGKAG